MFDFTHLDKVAFIENDKTISYKELDADIKTLGAYLNKRDVIFILSSNTYAPILAYISALEHKVVPLLLNKDLPYTSLCDLIKIYDPLYLFVPADFAYPKDCKEVFSIEGFLLLERTSLSKEINEELALLLSTSGSTSSAKLVRLSYKNILSNTKAIIESIALDASDITITSLPMFYAFGLSIINTYLYQGATIVLTNSPIVQREFWNLMDKYKVTSLSGVPYTYQLLDKFRLLQRKLPYLKVLTQAGGKLPLYLHEKIANFAKEKNLRFYVMYGAAEATARMSCLDYKMTEIKCGSVGVALTGGKFSLLDDKGNEVKSNGGSGILCYYGKNVALGYATNVTDLALGDNNQGRLVTHDIAKIEDGYLYIVGRSQRFLKVYGNKVALDELENILLKKFTQYFLVCHGFDDHVYIFVEGKDNERLQKDLLDYICSYTHLNKSAFSIIFLKTIPKNEAGKILYKKLEQYYAKS